MMNAKVEVKGVCYTELILSLLKNNIKVVKIKKGQDVFVLYLDKDNFYRFIELYKGDNVRIIYKNIINLILKYIKNNYILLTIFFSFLLSTFLISNIVFDIKVVSNNSKLSNFVEEEINKYGIKKFSLKKTHEEIENIKEKILKNNFDIFEWIEIYERGMIYEIRFQEKKIYTPDKKEQFCNIYAKKDGLIKKIKVQSGVAVVSENDYVKMGDLLIDGNIKKDDEVKGQMCARGQIFVEGWYEVNIKVPLSETTKIKTGKKHYSLIIGEKEIFKPKYKNYTSSKKRIFLDIFVIKNVEYREKTVSLSYDDAKEKGVEMARTNVKKKMDINDEILTEKILQKYVNNSTMYLDIFITTSEQIGVTNIPESGY